jgi:hypothetical protein
VGRELIARTAAAATEYDEGEQWLKALRLYSDLGSIEPAVPVWKEKLKLATRRVRLLALYSPGVLKDLQKAESKNAEEVEALLKEFDRAEAAAEGKPPTTAPARRRRATRTRPRAATSSASTGASRSAASRWTCSGPRSCRPARTTSARSATPI